MADDDNQTQNHANEQAGDATAEPEPVDLAARRQQRRPMDERIPNVFSPYDDMSDELEQQAREMVRVFRENMGELGERVRQAVEHASTLWNEASAAPATPLSTDPHPDELRARALMRRWVKRDFLVDPDLPTAMTPLSLRDADVWRVELRERGETRSLLEASEPYTGVTPPPPGPTLPVWDYDFPVAPEIASGERREPLAGTATRAACERCHGAGRRSCGHCGGKGFTACPRCHGRGRQVCPRCRGRGRIADATAERQARAAKSYMQVHAERFAQNAVERLADLSERLRQDYAVPLPPSADWVPTAPASGKTIPCPDCVDGTIACVCNNGKVVCEVCHGSAYEACPACAGTGQVIRRQHVVRRFDTRTVSRIAPSSGSDAAPDAAAWVTDQMLARASGDRVWAGPESALDGPAPQEAPERVWQAARELRRQLGEQPVPPFVDSSGERHVLSSQVTLSRIPVTRIAYQFAGRDYEAVAVGSVGEERFWADTFPPRWNRVSRFLQTVARDIAGESGRRSAGSRPFVTGSDRPTLGFRIVEVHEEPADTAQPEGTQPTGRSGDAPEAPPEPDPEPSAPSGSAGGPERGE